MHYLVLGRSDMVCRERKKEKNKNKQTLLLFCKALATAKAELQVQALPASRYKLFRVSKPKILIGKHS